MLSMHVPTSKNNRLCPESSTCLQKTILIHQHLDLRCSMESNYCILVAKFPP